MALDCNEMEQAEIVKGTGCVWKDHEGINNEARMDTDSGSIKGNNGNCRKLDCDVQERRKLVVVGQDPYTPLSRTNKTFITLSSWVTFGEQALAPPRPKEVDLS